MRQHRSRFTCSKSGVPRSYEAYRNRYTFHQEHVFKKEIKIRYVPTHDQRADESKKRLSVNRFLKMKDKLQVVVYSFLLERGSESDSQLSVIHVTARILLDNWDGQQSQQPVVVNV